MAAVNIAAVWVPRFVAAGEEVVLYVFGFERDEEGAVLGTPETGAARAGRVAAARACKGPAVKRMQSKRDDTSVPLMKSSKN